MATPTASFVALGANNLSKISLIILLLAIIHSNGHQSTVRCQDFEDLNNNKQVANNVGGSPQTFQPSRQFASAQTSSPVNTPQFQAASNSRQSFQRPVLSNRFAQQQQLSAQASTTSNTVVSGQQQTLPTTTSQLQQQQATAKPVAAPSNVEQLMKNALARTSRIEQAGGDATESRQDQNSEQIQSRSGSQFQPTQLQATSQSSPSSSGSNTRDRTASNADSSESQASTQPAEDPDKQTTALQAGTTGAHETVYSDQRFANLFARRNNQKKTKFTPTEQIKAKPTLPSFIKSPPDPKQFNANSAENQDRPIPQASANLISVRLQQQQSNQNRQSVSSQKKPIVAITSNSAANANNKRLNSQKQPPVVASQKASSASRGSGSQATANVTNKPVPNNPFNKSQQSSNDQANVIAMARRRLLANNANQQQQQRPVAN